MSRRIGQIRTPWGIWRYQRAWREVIVHLLDTGSDLGVMLLLALRPNTTGDWVNERETAAAMFAIHITYRVISSWEVAQSFRPEETFGRDLRGLTFYFMFPLFFFLFIFLYVLSLFKSH